METEFDDEIISINSIYGEDTIRALSEDGKIYAALRLPTIASIVLRLEVPSNYPGVPFSILGTETVGEDAPKGVGRKVVDMAREVLAQVYQPGEVCIYDLLGELGSRLESSILVSDEQTEAENMEAHLPDSPEDNTLGPQPPWTVSAPFAEKKSVFVARVCAVSSTAQAKGFIEHFLATDKKAAKASHNITAWRIEGANGIMYQDSDDDGEAAAGGRLLHLLQRMNVLNVVVVVTRWYGGIHLGPDRFRIINQAARSVLIAGGFAKEGESGKSSLKT